MKSTLATLTLVAALALPAAAQLAPNQTGSLVTGITFVSAGATSNALSTAWVEVKNHEEIAVQWKQVCSATNVPAAALSVTTTFGASMVPSNWVTIATLATPVSSDATTARNIGTNINIGSYRYFAVVSQANAGTNSIATNSSYSGTAGTISWILKDRRFGIR